jgi:MFS family permease
MVCVLLSGMRQSMLTDCRPASIYALTCGCSLILSGAVADVVGSRFMYILGCFLQSAFTLASGLAQTSFQLIFFRALAGIAIALCLPSAVSLITSYFPHGQRRNIAFAMMGAGQPIGFSIGLVVGGILADGPGWRAGFYISAAINTIFLALAVFGLPKPAQAASMSLRRLRTEIDWPGALILSTALGLLSYVFA